MAFEIQIIKWLQSTFSPTLNVAMSYIAFFSDFTIVLAVFFLFWVNKKRAYAVYFALTQGLSALIQKTLKAIIARPRPYVASSEIAGIFNASGTSFPSGHSITAMGVFLFVIYFIYSHSKSKKERTVFTVLGVGYLLLNAFNRMFLGQHFLTDILGGYAIMLVLCFVAYLLYKPYLKLYTLITNKLTTKCKKGVNNEQTQKTSSNS